MSDRADEPGAEASDRGFDVTQLDRTKIAIPLLRDIDLRRRESQARQRLPVIIDLNMSYVDGLSEAREVVRELIGSAHHKYIDQVKGKYCPQYVFARLTPRQIERLARKDERSDGTSGKGSSKPFRMQAIYKIWPDFPVIPHLDQSLATVKADAARAAFRALGKGVVWAVLDTGIQWDHPHFEKRRNLELEDGIDHHDFTGDETEDGNAVSVEQPLDRDGHGTHVAGIIAGEWDLEYEARKKKGNDQEKEDVGPKFAAGAERTDKGARKWTRWSVEKISGVAPLTKLVSLKVLSNKAGTSGVSNLLAAIGYIQDVNEHGRWLRIHGVNMSVGYGFDPEWFGCGHSPLCVEVDRLVKSGVSVVVAAGNTGYWERSGDTDDPRNAGVDLTINDPGNAELAVTVGATHKDKPHTYGVSYFSSKGPTGDGRVKPDLVAPGENILSCATGAEKKKVLKKNVDDFDYRLESGTSMAAPHVSGAVAAFLSIRPEFKGQPLRVKEIFLESATDLGRERYFQGHGLIDLMRAIQSV